MEIKEEDIKNWIIEFSEDLESTRSDTSREKILKDTRQHIEETNSRGKKIFCDWLNLIQF